MKEFILQDIVDLIQGKVIRGNDRMTIKRVGSFNEHIKHSNLLFFLRNKKRMDYSLLSTYHPIAIVTDMDLPELHIPNCTVIVVTNVEKAYWEFVEFYRSLFSIPVVAVTGTCGKTTTKEMIRHILSYDFQVQSTIRSVNSPLDDIHYLTGIDDRTEAAVFETAAVKPGYLLNHGRYFKPTIGLITNIGIDHLDESKTLENYIKSKHEMAQIIQSGGTLILNMEDQYSKNIPLEGFKGKVLYVGKDKRANYQALNIKYEGHGMVFQLVIHEIEYPVRVYGFGEHQVYNALFAIAVAHELGVGIKEAIERISTYRNLQRHLESSIGKNGATVIDDTWNSNLTSLNAALEVLHHLGNGKKKVAVLADMSCLGDKEQEVYQKVGQKIAKTDVDVLFASGRSAEEVIRSAKSEGWNGKSFIVSLLDPFLELEIQSELNDRTILLIKGSMYNIEIMELARKLKKK